jgi:hypothetical protein
VEWWILSGLVVAVLVVGALRRIRNSHRRQSEDGQNIYPLW